jgi:hypothetical protein
MKANTVFVHRRYPRAALQGSGDDFYAIQTKGRDDLRLAEQVTGDLGKNKIKWFFNVTRGTLISINVLGRFQNLKSAIGAISVRRNDDP